MLTIQPNLHIIDALIQHGFTGVCREDNSETIVGRIEIGEASAGVFYKADTGLVFMALFTKESSRKRGDGTRVLQAICNAADHAGVAISLGAKPHGESQSHDSLVSWYERREFVVDEDWDRKDQNEPVKMKRLPQVNLD